MHIATLLVGSFVAGWGGSNWFHTHGEIKKMELGPSQIAKPVFTTFAGAFLLAVSFAFK